MQCLQWGSNLQHLNPKSSTLSLSHRTPYCSNDIFDLYNIACAPSEDSDQTVNWPFQYAKNFSFLHADMEDCSEWVNAQSD